jgi:6-pyruvoyltetrahydropterin/6-carboxytetrahydropterin synthase
MQRGYEFGASHQLGGLPPGHPSGRRHWHDYRVRVQLIGELDPFGMVIDEQRLAPFASWIRAELDQTHLNDLPEFSGPRGLNPTAENLCRYLSAQLHEALLLSPAVGTRVGVSPTRRMWVWWDPP